jgi:penicillin-binding protein 2
MTAMARRLGLGAPQGIDLPGEQPGFMPTQAWKLKRLGVPWQKGETLIAGIGQGFMTATPLQLAVMCARVANGGKRVVPTLRRETVAGALSADEAVAEAMAGPPAPPEEEAPELGLPPAALAFVREAMSAVINEPGGTAHGSRIAEAGFSMAGKTGTSQVRRISKAERITGVLKNEERPWRDRDHALFVGFGPVEAPRYAVCVVVEHGGGGSAVAAPIARDMIHAALKRDATPSTASAADRKGGQG